MERNTEDVARQNRMLWLRGVAVIGIVTSQALYALLQERIMTLPYTNDNESVRLALETPSQSIKSAARTASAVERGQESLAAAAISNNNNTVSNGERFTDSLFLVLSNRIAALIAACIATLLLPDADPTTSSSSPPPPPSDKLPSTAPVEPTPSSAPRYTWQKLSELFTPVAPVYMYVGVSLTNVLASSCQYEALKWVTFSTQTVAKCCKIVTVMTVGTVLSRKRYSLRDFATAVSVVLGAAAFMLTGSIASHETELEAEETKHSMRVLVGLALMLLFMFFDALTSAMQEKMFSGFSMSIFDQMVHVNLSSALLSILSLLLGGRLWHCLTRMMRCRQLVIDVCALAASSVVGQICILFTIKQLGAVVFASVVTLRQMASVLLSNLLFGHRLTALQWVAAVYVFGTLLLNSFLKNMARKQPDLFKDSTDIKQQ